MNRLVSNLQYRRIVNTIEDDFIRRNVEKDVLDKEKK